MSSSSLNENPSDSASAAPHDQEVPGNVSQTLDLAIEEMLAQLDPAENQASESASAMRPSPAEADSQKPVAGFEDALSPINATLQQQSEALVGLTQALQGLQLAVADLQFANRTTGSDALEPSAPLRIPVPEADDTPEHDHEEPAEVSGSSQEQCWDQIKAALLSGDETSSAAAAAPPVTDEPVSEDVTYDVQYDLVPHAEILQMDAEQLRKLLLDQERVISRLVQSARAEKKAQISLTPEDLRTCADDMPEEMASQVRATLKTLDEQARLGELELSLERARISRQLSHLEDTRQILESNARALGLEIGPEGRIVGDLKSVRNGGTKNRRWLGALGFGD